MLTERQKPSLNIRPGAVNDLDNVMSLIAGAKRFMRSQGNMTQWAGDYPSVNNILQDIEKGQLFIIEDSKTDEALMCFSVLFTPDPYYSVITDGQWLDDTKPYITIHRMASSGKISRLSDLAFGYCATLCDNIRVDTHQQNITMLNAITRAGFKRCGIVTVADGTPRIAFQKLSQSNN